MKPIEFEESNKIFKKPHSMTDEECGSLPVYQDEKHIISRWQLTFMERIKVLFTGKVWLWIFGQAQPPVSLGCESPFNKNGGKHEHL